MMLMKDVKNYQQETSNKVATMEKIIKKLKKELNQYE
jgi:hypothetical protein